MNEAERGWTNGSPDRRHMFRCARIASGDDKARGSLRDGILAMLLIDYRATGSGLPLRRCRPGKALVFVRGSEPRPAM